MPHHPEPRFTCTIPSIHDDTTLNCRVYHPDILSRPRSGDSQERQQWRNRGIVIAHPYAPMGGSYDDRVVGIVVDEFLKRGWMVGTFNFRGAHGSKGRTSWSGRPELDDYISFAAFFMHYLSYLHPLPASDAVFTPDQSPVSQKQSSADLSRSPTEQSPVLVLAGYSYGSLILKHLPPVPSILQPFANPASGSAADEILLRAHKLADESNLEWINAARDNERQKRSRGHEGKLSVTVGGEETSPEKRRSSREIRRSLDGRRSLDLSGRLRSLSHRRRKEGLPQTPTESSTASLTITVPDVKYLLISPLMPPVSTLAAPVLGYKFWNKSHGVCQEVVAKHVSLAIFGDHDIFTSAKKVRDWAERLKSESGSRFSSVEIAGAGHFWHEHGAEEKLRTALREWEAQVR
ncbi:hypothetical protein BU26DRAFT_514441 [Trematosphaeria pertusa]|uniref:Alpha/beta-hydrolase n=1 Tax=Trematosphaeria pertusa TaxID=390896 RepID=A0A6A6IW13_9PLEO|nr:uncharacterized protein BU26DRAFT_514441 [Trematosphaeria pertusa]KAF2254556.1 hypothetical protein BU26DRAFT_514441 [Trematosphaeria pertusa]